MSRNAPWLEQTADEEEYSQSGAEPCRHDIRDALEVVLSAHHCSCCEDDVFISVVWRHGEDWLQLANSKEEKRGNELIVLAKSTSDIN